MLEAKYSKSNFQDKLICFPDVVLDSVFSLEDLLYVHINVRILNLEISNRRLLFFVEV